MARVWGFLVGAALLAAPAVSWAHEKRADRCGCHHQYGLRHCHPNKKTSYCEAPVKATAPAAKAPAREQPAREKGKARL